MTALSLMLLVVTLVSGSAGAADKAVYRPDRGRHLGWNKSSETTTSEERAWRILWIGGYRQPNVWAVEEQKRMEKDRADKERAFRKKDEDQARREKEKTRLDEYRKKLESDRKARDEKARLEREKKCR